MNEQVLVFPKYVLDLLQPFSGVSKDVSILSHEQFKYSLFYMDRPAAEEDPRYLQLIPYCVLRKRNLVFTYQRTKKGGESRLHDKWSLGCGGHLNPCDGEAKASYENGFKRELAEEVNLKGNYDSKVLGLIWNDETPVNSVHFGVVHEINLLDDAVLEFNDPALDNGVFMLYDKLSERVGDFESWSQLVIKELLK